MFPVQSVQNQLMIAPNPYNRMRKQLIEDTRNIISGGYTWRLFAEYNASVDFYAIGGVLLKSHSGLVCCVTDLIAANSQCEAEVLALKALLNVLQWILNVLNLIWKLELIQKILGAWLKNEDVLVWDLRFVRNLLEFQRLVEKYCLSSCERVLQKMEDVMAATGRKL